MKIKDIPWYNRPGIHLKRKDVSNDLKSLLTLELYDIMDLQNEVRVPYPIKMGSKYLSLDDVKNLLRNDFRW